ncbi:MAG: hypothetical protein M0R17_04520 [Candidatus Omnitrophica bacterium]|jgi:hypothetical protein|nr:hypothetical protein [Candidatus Omnitrophota bacterium]
MKKQIKDDDNFDLIIFLTRTLLGKEGDSLEKKDLDKKHPNSFKPNNKDDTDYQNRKSRTGK